APAGDVGQSLAAANTKADQALAGLDSKASASSVQQLQAAIRKQNRNLLELDGWRAAAAMPFGKFFLNESVPGENAIIEAAGPYGDTIPVWQCLSKGRVQDGGWNYSPLALDSRKAYRFSVWVRTVSGTAATYFGPRLVSSIGGGGPHNNPYFVDHIGRDKLTLGKWFLMVGFLFPEDYSGSQQRLSGVYDAQTGMKVLDGTDFQFTPKIGSIAFRAYQYYSLEDGAEQWFALPRADLLDGNEPSLENLLTGVVNDGISATLTRLSTVETDLKGKAGAQELTTLQSTVGANQSAVEKQLKTLSEEGRAIG
ncbi:hypothetical protein CEK28_18515, partial [Xenophilus sp. AP218F]